MSFKNYSSYFLSGILAVAMLMLHSCKKDPALTDPVIPNPDGWVYDPTPFQLQVPGLFPPMPVSTENPLTQQGVKLGKMLFFDPILSGNSTLSCAGCHNPENSFSDSRIKSLGIDGLEGERHSMPLINLGYLFDFFWDGQAETLEHQVVEPVQNPIEMNLDWGTAIKRLKNHPQYPKLFYEAFGKKNFTRDEAAKALSQFVKTLVSGNSTFDKIRRNEIFADEAILNGLDVYLAEDKGDCFHCHGDPSANFLLTDNTFRNNGLDATHNDLGRGRVTGDPTDIGKFKVPTLRNIELTAPYMHDGRFATLEEVIEFYNSGTKHSSTVDPNISKHIPLGGLNLTPKEKADLLALLKSFTDQSFTTNPEFKNPFE